MQHLTQCRGSGGAPSTASAALAPCTLPVHRARRQARGSAATVLVAAAALAACVAALNLFPGWNFASGSARSPAARALRHGVAGYSKVALAAEAVDVAEAPAETAADAPVEAPAETPTADAQAEPDAVQAAATPAAPEISSGPLFQEMNVTNRTEVKKLMRAMVGAFNNGKRAVDLVLIDPRCKHTLVYAICSVPSQFDVSAQILLRRRDRRLRLRVTQHMKLEEEAEPEVFRVARTTNVTSFGYKMKSSFVDQIGNNLKRSVTLKFQGKETASRALMAIENAMHYANRELAFRPRFHWEEAPAKPEEGEGAAAEGAAPGKNLVIEASVVAI